MHTCSAWILCHSATAEKAINITSNVYRNLDDEKKESQNTTAGSFQFKTLSLKTP